MKTEKAAQRWAAFSVCLNDKHSFSHKKGHRLR
jgi:hypothetical protein